MKKLIVIPVALVVVLALGSYSITSYYDSQQATGFIVPALPTNFPTLLPDQAPDDPGLDTQHSQEEAQIKEQNKIKAAGQQAYLDSLKDAVGTQIASFSTSLAGHDASGRIHNIELANAKIDGTLLLPGQPFSFNAVLGDSNDPAGGWQEATVIVGEEFEQGYGGGICQVSSTLFNAIAQAKLTVMERYSHSLPVGYVPVGHDATVSYPELDFKFFNSLQAPVRVKARIQNNQVICEIYSLPPRSS